MRCNTGELSPTRRLRGPGTSRTVGRSCAAGAGEGEGGRGGGGICVYIIIVSIHNHRSRIY